jgi:DNA mismatch repair protein MutS
VFVYYIEVSTGASDRVRDEFGYIRKQTLSNTERFITSELKDMETKILQAAEKELALELELFTAVRDQAKQEVPLLQRLARIIAELDMILAFARVAKENNYVRPRFTDNHEIEIKNLRHPVMELASANFIPNDVKMGPDDGILLITGPNMGGKSTYMRQVALAAIMAQIGSFVACDRARLPLFDAIFTRIGAADDIISGQSTFMVEMTEVNKALMALAQAIIEFIDAHIGCKTLFSTHYHELTALAESIPRLKNVHVAAEEVAGDIVFLYKVCSGAADKSYGINVAKLASLPLPVILRATDILNKLETQKPDARLLSVQNYQPPLLFDSKTEKETLALEELKQLDLYNMSPIAALAALEKLQKLLKK